VDPVTAGVRESRLRAEAALHAARGDRTEAVAWLAQAVAEVRHAQGPGRLAEAAFLARMATLEEERGALVSADTLWRAVLALRQRHLPPGSPLVAESRRALDALAVRRAAVAWSALAGPTRR
jgi:hypothetical protein